MLIVGCVSSDSIDNILAASTTMQVGILQRELLSRKTYHTAAASSQTDSRVQ